MIGHFGLKLSGKDQWLFKTAVVVRKATFWGMVGGPIERESLRKALKDIERVTRDAPADIPQEFVENLKKISEFTFDPAIGERELRQELMKLSMFLRNYPR